MATVTDPYVNKQPKVVFYDHGESNPSQRYRWTLFMSSDKVAASSEGYSSAQLAKENFLKIEKHIEWLRTNNKV
jgi:uncharacterized protein YegP (UPF0339 family)